MMKHTSKEMPACLLVVHRVQLMDMPDEIKIVARNNEYFTITLLQLYVVFISVNSFLQKFSVSKMR